VQAVLTSKPNADASPFMRFRASSSESLANPFSHPKSAVVRAKTIEQNTSGSLWQMSMSQSALPFYVCSVTEPWTIVNKFFDRLRVLG
jgi:hypothetical protein